jgi:hypothetical protein
MLGFHLSPAAIPSVPDPLAPFFSRGGGQSVAIAEGSGGSVSVWSELGDGHAAWLTLDNNDPALRLSWRETLLAKLRSVYPVGDMTLSGAWNQMQSSGSGLAASYTGNRAVSTGSLSATADVTVDRAAPYDVWVHYTGRTSGGYVRVQIDGSDALVNALDDPAGLGFKAFSSYSSLDLNRRQVVRVATGLTGSHQVTLSYGGAASPGGAAILIEAVSISAGLADPRILPPMWQPATVYEMGDEVQWQGTYYAARANGVSGAIPPTHTSGIASDGALDWRADNRPSYPEFVAIDYASEREYAARFSVAGQVSEVGGQTHGNEPLISRTVLLDGAAWVPVTTGIGLSVGACLTITEQTEWQTVAAAKVADCTLLRTVMPGEIRHDVSITPTGPQADVEWFYAGMLPMVHWDGESGMQVFHTVKSADTAVALAVHAGQNPPNIDLGSDGRIGLTAQVGTTELRYGLAASVDTGGLTEAVGAFLRPNIDARAASGSLDWTAKAYVEPTMAGGWSFGATDAITLVNRHVLSVR